MLLLPLLVLTGCDNNSASARPSGSSTNSAVTSTTGSNSSNTGSSTPTPEPEKDAIELVSNTTDVERDGTITLRVRVNKNIADRTVNFKLKTPKDDGKIISFVDAKDNVLEGTVSCVIKGLRTGQATVVISMHDKTQSDTLEVPVTVTTKLNTPDRVWNTIANKQSYTFTAKPVNESEVTASNTTVTRVTSKSIVVTDGNGNPVKVNASDVNSSNLINGGLSYSRKLNLGGFPMDKDGNAVLDGTTDEDHGFSTKSVLTNYFNGDLADVYGITLDKNGRAMYIAKNAKTGEFYNHLQAFTNDEGYVNSSTLSGLGTDSYTPYNYLSYYGNNSVRLSADIHSVSGFYGFKAVNKNWLSFTKNFDNVYELDSYAPVPDDTSTTEENEADMKGMKFAYAKMLIWNMMSPNTFVPALLNFIGDAGEANFKWSEFASLVDVKINILANDNLSLSLSGTSELSNYYSQDFPELIGTLSNVSSTTLNDLTDINTFVNRTDLEATDITFSDDFTKMVNYISSAQEYKETMYDGSSFPIDLYQKDGEFFFIDYSKAYLDLVNEDAQTEDEKAKKVGYFADADKKGWEVIFNEDYTIESLGPVELQGGGQADYSVLENQISANNFYTTRQKTWNLKNDLLATFSQTMFAPFSGYDKGFVSYSPLTWVSVFSDYWSGVEAEEDTYGTWMTIVSPTLNDEGNVTKVSMTRAMSQGDSSSYSVFYPNSISACGEGETVESMTDSLKTWYKSVQGKHTNEIEAIN